MENKGKSWRRWLNDKSQAEDKESGGWNGKERMEGCVEGPIRNTRRLVRGRKKELEVGRRASRDERRCLEDKCGLGGGG